MKIIIDLECTCTDSNEFPREEMEIIEIGAVLFNGKGDKVDLFQTFVRPSVNPILTDFCTKLTTITQIEVDSAPGIKEALISLDIWALKQIELYGVKEWSSWGFFDKSMLTKSASFSQIKLELLHCLTHVNETKVFQSSQGLRRKVGVGRALRILNMNFTGTKHRAVDDVMNIAKIVYR